jgi:hypothetical protein
MTVSMLLLGCCIACGSGVHAAIFFHHVPDAYMCEAVCLIVSLDGDWIVNLMSRVL